MTTTHTRVALITGAGTGIGKAAAKALHGAGYTVSWIDGKVTRAQLRAAKDWFQAGRIDVLLVLLLRHHRSLAVCHK